MDPLYIIYIIIQYIVQCGNTYTHSNITGFLDCSFFTLVNKLVFIQVFWQGTLVFILRFSDSLKLLYSDDSFSRLLIFFVNTDRSYVFEVNDSFNIRKQQKIIVYEGNHENISTVSKVAVVKSGVFISTAGYTRDMYTFSSTPVHRLQLFECEKQTRHIQYGLIRYQQKGSDCLHHPRKTSLKQEICLQYS